MTDTADREVGPEAALRDQLALFRPLLALSMVMTNSRDETEILRIATTTVPSLGGGRAEAVYLDGDWQVVGSIARPGDADVLGAQLAAPERTGGPLQVAGGGWGWAYPWPASPT